MQRYYSENWSESEPFSLSEDESRHCISVMRNREGNEIHVMDGRGTIMLAEIITANPKSVLLQYVKTIASSPAPNPLHVAISPTKSNDRIEWFIEKACEIGIGQITPLICQRTERNKINIDRWRKIVIAACKQSSLLHFPVIHAEIKFDKFIQSIERAKQGGQVADVFIASIEAKESWHVNNRNIENIIIIGPEGDFSEGEFEQMRALNWTEVKLSDNILRVETAGIVAVSQWNAMI